MSLNNAWLADGINEWDESVADPVRPALARGTREIKPLTPKRQRAATPESLEEALYALIDEIADRDAARLD